jgi:hypothetical protein
MGIDSNKLLLFVFIYLEIYIKSLHVLIYKVTGSVFQNPFTGLFTPTFYAGDCINMSKITPNLPPTYKKTIDSNNPSRVTFRYEELDGKFSGSAETKVVKAGQLKGNEGVPKFEDDDRFIRVTTISFDDGRKPKTYLKESTEEGNDLPVADGASPTTLHEKEGAVNIAPESQTTATKVEEKQPPDSQATAAKEGDKQPAENLNSDNPNFPSDADYIKAAEGNKDGDFTTVQANSSTSAEYGDPQAATQVAVGSKSNKPVFDEEGESRAIAADKAAANTAVAAEPVE